ncbi:Os12g0409600 [Oryza sativa Japonica Group]|uniref:Os12g0409600 protein n=1 Tax=Oryza sativa subsp. japonica TaxID=39947 RepID=Q0INQ5_ORYSJ|nr:Os12g0409600 [Oryza sativa Japonica Group]|eukprot:NP_001066641.1 Os12g0409600 [Oryza sativa Japonica Group]
MMICTSAACKFLDDELRTRTRGGNFCGCPCHLQQLWIVRVFGGGFSTVTPYHQMWGDDISMSNEILEKKLYMQLWIVRRGFSTVTPYHQMWGDD